MEYIQFCTHCQHVCVYIDHEASKKKDRSRFTWPPNSNKRTSKVHPPDTPIMTWYYSAGRPLPVWPQSSPSNSSDNGGLDYAYHRLLDKHDSEVSE